MQDTSHNLLNLFSSLWIFMHSFIQQGSIQYILCVRLCSKSLCCINDKTKHCLPGAYLMGVIFAQPSWVLWAVCGTGRAKCKLVPKYSLLLSLSLSFLFHFSFFYCPFLRTLDIFKSIQQMLLKHLLIWQYVTIFNGHNNFSIRSLSYKILVHHC